MYRSPRLWLTCAAVVLALTACGQAASTPGAAASRLSWQSATSPAGSQAPIAYLPAPSDGRITYACDASAAGAPGKVRFWRSADRGASWSSGANPPYTGQVSSCALTVDADNSQRVLVSLDTLKLGASPSAAAVFAFLSQDGGKSWLALPQAGPHGVTSMVSYRGTIYASGYGLSATGVDLRDVWVSRDSGGSWTALGASSLAPNPFVWINPQTAELIGTNGFGLIPTLWDSGDGGATWTRVAVPNVVSSGGQQTFVVTPAGTGWRICAAGQTVSGSQHANALQCSADLGNTWTRAPALKPSLLSPKGSSTSPVSVFAIANDSTVLAAYEDTAADPQLAALTTFAGAWSSMGTLSAASVVPGAAGTTADSSNGSAASFVYATGPGNGILWVSSGDPAHPFLTASYS
jgi:hypothetical protein